MKYNTQNSKIASITEKTLIVGIDVGSQGIMQEHLIGVIMSIQENHLHSAMMKKVLWRLRTGWMKLLKITTKR